MGDLIDALLEDEADRYAHRTWRSGLHVDDWPQIVNYVRDVMGTSGMATLRSWAEIDDDELAILSLVDCFAGHHTVRSLEELRRKFGDDLLPAIGAAALVGFARWQPSSEVPQ